MLVLAQYPTSVIQAVHIAKLNHQLRLESLDIFSVRQYRK